MHSKQPRPLLYERLASGRRRVDELLQRDAIGVQPANHFESPVRDDFAVRALVAVHVIRREAQVRHRFGTNAAYLESVSVAALRVPTQYRWLGLALLWPLWADAQTADEPRSALHGEGLRRGAVPESVQVLDEIVERLTDAPLYRDNAVELLLDGPQTHDAMIEAIDSAKHHVHLETYIFADDEVGTEFAEALAAKARSGVTVRVIYDSIGSRSASGDFWSDLKAAGVLVRTYNPADPVQDQNPFDIDTRDHRKLLIVDGRVAFTGGINIDRNYVRASDVVGGESRSSGWRDTHIRIAGPAVAAFQNLFVSLWEKLDSPLSMPPYAPERQKEGNTLVRVLSAVGGNREVSEIWVAYQAAAKVARERLWITQSYFAPDEELLAAIREAAARGVDVRILVAGFSDSEVLLNASRAYYSDLLESGVKIYESQEQILHAKTMVVDGYWSTVGSSNLDYLSFLHNHETNAVIVGDKFAAQLEDVFLADLGNAVPIEHETWRKRSLWQRTKQLGSYLIRYRL
jgi:cardiolipin synthase A/B